MTTTDAARTITDSRVLAAMAHPLRRRLLDALKVDGPSTASMLANWTGQGIGNISHHMKVLANAALGGGGTAAGARPEGTMVAAVGHEPTVVEHIVR
jgi:DNA-binding transcriptional ArsR family regulator